MKNTYKYVFAAMVLVFVVLGSLMGSCSTFVPYSRDTMSTYALFEGMINPIQESSPNVIDIFGEAKASSDCKGTQATYTTDAGHLCFSPQQIKLLQTRGGNSETSCHQCGL